MVNIRYIVSIIMTLVTYQMVAQDIHFSQFYASPLTLNPAQTGWYKGDIRMSGNYRTQWKAIDNKPYATIGAGVEKQFHYFTNTYSFGLQAVTDETGYVGLVSNKVLLSGAFSKKLNGHKISAGIQAGVVYKSTNVIRYTFDDQFDLGGSSVFNPKLPTAEVPGEPILYGLVNAGAMWSKRLTNRIEPEFGISIFNINTPKESFYGLDLNEAQLPIRTALYASGKYSLTNSIIVVPHVLYMSQKKATECLLGGEVEYKLSENIRPYIGTSIRYGLSRNFDASSWIGGMQINNWRVGLSYDVNISGLQQATNNRGAFEVSLIYITPSVQSTFIKIPCDRL